MVLSCTITKIQGLFLQSKNTCFIVIGLGGIEDEPKEMFNIPLEEAKYPDLYPSVFNKFSRPPEKSFFWKNGNLY